MKAKLHLETTIFGYIAARPARDLVTAGMQQVSRDWWDSRRDQFDLYISDFVIGEVSRGNHEESLRRQSLLSGIDVLEVDDLVTELAESILQEGSIPPKSAADASHLAVAIRHGMDFVMTWNCKHIANAEILRRIQRSIEEFDFEMPVICTPMELMGIDHDR